jgi:DNA repair exonuclease SbcCD ATPase subunit
MLTVPEFQRRLNLAQKKLYAKQETAKLVMSRGVTLETEVAELTETVEIMDKAAALLTSIGENKQLDAQNKIESLVSQGLQKIFGEEYSFHVVSSVKGRSPVVEFVIRSVQEDGSVLETGVLGSRGGGVAAVVGFLLRVVVLLLKNHGKSSILVLDESFVHVSELYLPRLAEFIREIVDKSNLQIIMVSHQTIFAEFADKVHVFKVNSKGLTVSKEM